MDEIMGTIWLLAQQGADVINLKDAVTEMRRQGRYDANRSTVTPPEFHSPSGPTR